MWPFFSRNVKRAHTDQSILHFFVLPQKRNDSQTIHKCSSSNKLFPQLVSYRYDLLWYDFFIVCGNWKGLLFAKVYRHSEGFSNRHVAAFFEITFSKEVRILHISTHNSTTLIPKFKNKVYTCEIFLTNLIVFCDRSTLYK